MNIITVSFGLNVAIGVTIWASDISLIAKIILTSVLIGKFVLYFSTMWALSSNACNKIKVVAVGALNIGMAVYALLQGATYLIVTTVTTSVLVVIWMCVIASCFRIKQDKEE